MEWFSGDIAEAVTISKERDVIFVVFIDGKTDDSTAMTELLNNPAIASTLSDPTRYLAVRIESDTDTYKQFAQIYRLVPVPSIFFIGKHGQPIEIVASNVQTVDALQERIVVAEGIFKSSPLASSSAAVVAPVQQPDAVPVRTAVKKSPAVEKKQPKMDEKATKDELEMQKMKEERKREKAQDEEARRRCLEQIKLDRQRRQDQEPITTTPTKPVTPAAPAPVRNLPDTTRIQFRKPTGESIVDTFKSDGPFGDVWKYAKASLEFKEFVLATAMPPRKVYSVEHSDSTLIELNLAPSAVLLVIPLTKPSLIGGSSTSGGVVATVSNFIFTIFWSVMTPLLALWNRFTGKKPPTNRPQATTVDADADEVAPGPNISSEILQKRNLSRYNLGPAGSSSSATAGSSGGDTPQAAKPPKSTSNIHRLKDYDSDDDESNTYNGNSTQQM